MLSKLSNNQSSGRKTLLILTVVFLLPFTVAATLHLIGWKAGGRSYGELLQPPRSLQLRDLQDIQGKPFGAKQWEKKWTMVTVASVCEAACQGQLKTLQKLRISLGKDTDRVQQVLLIPAEIKAETLLTVRQNDADLIVLAGVEVADFVAQFKTDQSKPQAQQVYLVDPLGNLMMSYAPGFEPKGLRRDLLRLLKNSWAG
jgi:hypothetical protein